MSWSPTSRLDAREGRIRIQSSHRFSKEKATPWYETKAQRKNGTFFFKVKRKRVSHSKSSERTLSSFAEVVAFSISISISIKAHRRILSFCSESFSTNIWIRASNQHFPTIKVDKKRERFLILMLKIEHEILFGGKSLGTVRTFSYLHSLRSSHIQRVERITYLRWK